MHEALFEPIRLGAIEAKNRILMAPLTRGRSDPGSMPNAMIAEYYRQRSDAGLIISEAVAISVEGAGWPAAPCIYNDAQAEAWKLTTHAVHEAGGRIVMQLWHMGRLVHPDFLGGEAPVSASAWQRSSARSISTAKLSRRLRSGWVSRRKLRQLMTSAATRSSTA